MQAYNRIKLSLPYLGKWLEGFSEQKIHTQIVAIHLSYIGSQHYVHIYTLPYGREYGFQIPAELVSCRLKGERIGPLIDAVGKE